MTTDPTTPAAPDLDAPGRVPPWTVKGVAPQDRDEFNAAARRRGQTLGQWLAAAGRAAIAAERFQRLPSPPQAPTSQPPPPDAPGQPPPSSAPSLADLAALIRELPQLSTVKGAGGVSRAIRRAVVAGLARHAPPSHPPRPAALPAPGPNGQA